MTDQPYPDNFIITLPENYLTAIGKVTVMWGTLEAVVDIAIRKFAAFELYDSRGAIITAHMTWPLKMDILEALVTELLPEYPQLARFGTVKPLLKKAQEGRNRISHGQWGYENGEASKLRATARGRLRTSIMPITIAEIEAIASDIGRAGAATMKLVVNK
jgi:hypothetical protein